MPVLEAKEASSVRVQSVARGIAILLTVARSAKGLRAKEISESLGLSRQTVYHLVHTLVTVGALRRSGEGLYVLGFASAQLGDAFARHLAPSEILAPRVRAIVEATGETAYASGWMDGEVVALVTAPGVAAVHAAEVPKGFKAHAHARASGKLLLAYADERERDTYLERHALDPITPRTIVNRKDLDLEFAAIRKNGYALDNEEFAEGLCCLAVPVQKLENRFALCVSVPQPRFAQNSERYIKALLQISRMQEETR